MANPTGSTYLQANLGYTWADGDVYQIPQTDQVEGAATGASFSGLGVENQPHQLLLNKIQLIHSKQLTDETNISALQTFAALFTSTVGPSGWLKIGSQDTVRGQIQIILQWGVINLIGSSYSALLTNTPLNFNFPIAFPNAIWRLWPYWETNWAANVSQVGNILSLQTLTPLQLQGNKIVLGTPSSFVPGLVRIAHTATDGGGITGIGWVAIGY